MKDSKTIISHLKKHPSMKSLNQQECYDILIGLLPKSLTNSIKFLYTKHDTLFFVLNHPSAKMEFNYKRNLIKDILKKIVTFHPNCKCIDLKDIKAFVTNRKEPKVVESKESKIYYIEESRAEFTNIAKDERLFELFEEIKKVIKSNIDG